MRNNKFENFKKAFDDKFSRFLTEFMKLLIMFLNTIIGSVWIGLIWGFGLFLILIPLCWWISIPYNPTYVDSVCIVTVITFLRNLPQIKYANLNNL